MVPFNALSHYDTWVPNEEAASSFYPVPHAHVDNAGMGTNDAFLGSSDGAHTGWQVTASFAQREKSAHGCITAGATR
jgi:hypothetical protein